MADKPRVFVVKAEYIIAVGAVAITNDDVRARIERRVHEMLFELRQNQRIDVDVINSALEVTEQLP